MKRILSVLVALLLMASVSMGASKQVVATSNAHTIIAASPNQRIVVQSIAILATSTTSVQISLYNGDNYLLGSASVKLTVDLDGIDGPAGIVLPFNEAGWFYTDTVNEVVSMSMSGTPASTPVIVLVTYRYQSF
jgi:hypothetical protein